MHRCVDVICSGNYGQPIPHHLSDVAEHCARTCCQVRPAGDLYFNRSTRRLYCATCAALLNKANYADALRLYNGPLCITYREHLEEERVAK